MWANLHETANFVTSTWIIFYQKVPLVKISIQVSSISRSAERVSHRYIYNYRESCHDAIIASVSPHEIKLHITGFMRVSAALFSDQLKPVRSKMKLRHEWFENWQSLLIPCNPIAMLIFPVSLYNFHFIWKKCSRITYFCRLAVSFRYFKSR